MLNGWFSSNDDICPDNYNYFRFKLQACVAVRSGSCICTAMRPSRWTVIVWKCCPGVCLRLGFHPIWQRITHHLCVVHAFCAWHWLEHAFGSSSLEWQSSVGRACPRLCCGTCRDVLHSHYDRKHLRCYCSCRVHVLCVGRLHCPRDSNVQRWCLRRLVV